MTIHRLLLALCVLFSLSLPVHAGGARPHRVHALTGARIIVAPGRVIENATLIIRDGRIEAVGAHVQIPADARVHDLRGSTLHAGFIDPYVTLGRLQGKKMKARKPFSWDDDDEPESEEKPKEPDTPNTSVASSSNPRIHPDLRVVDVLTPEADVLEAMRAQGIVLVQAVPDSGIFRGTSALCLTRGGDARENVIVSDAGSVIAFDPIRREHERSYPASMMGNVAAIRQTFADAAWYEQAWRIEAERPLGSKRPQTDLALAALGSVLHGRMPVVFECTTLLEDLRSHALLDEIGVSRRITVLSGEEWRRLDWVKRLRGDLVLPLAFTPAPVAKSEGEWLDVSLLALRRWRNDPANPRWMEEAGIPFAFTTHRLSSVSGFRRAVIRAVEAGLPREAALAALTVRPARMLGIGDRFGTLDVGRSATIVVEDGDPFAPRTRVKEVWIEGVRCFNDEEPPKKAAPRAKPAFRDSDYANGPDEPFAPPVGAPSAVLVKNATIWTQGPQGTLEHADMLVRAGTIAAVGNGLVAPPGAVVIDATGRHVTPGLVDAHSHTAIDGDVNEGTAAITAEVRIKDVLDPFSLAIWRQLAGGVTVANVMHGSANAIGGQVVTCKWKFGEGPEGLAMPSAPEGIKFALGENPKQSNWGPRSRSRYPQTRMGVAEIIRERFVAAKDYRKSWDEYRAGRRPLAPRKDYQLEALLEVLDGKRLVQCHSYRQDEILMLIRLAEEQGFKVKAFQHVLEGYKVADEIARHGAGASTFSDWWAYKHEVMDAIPYNGALMHQRGVVVSFNSDSDEQARRLNSEAGKAVRYGSLKETDALAFVTINAARHLGVENRVGSLEAGKDADFVVWSAHPLVQDAICLQTWIEGRKFFDRPLDVAAARRRAADHNALVQKAKKEPTTESEAGEEDEKK